MYLAAPDRPGGNWGGYWCSGGDGVDDGEVMGTLVIESPIVQVDVVAKQVIVHVHVVIVVWVVTVFLGGTWRHLLWRWAP